MSTDESGWGAGVSWKFGLVCLSIMLLAVVAVWAANLWDLHRLRSEAETPAQKSTTTP